MSRCIAIVVMLLLFPNLYSQNPIPAENSLPGNPPSEWDISGAGDLSIQGFATEISVNKGQAISFKITITGSNKNFTIKIYRLGYYQGNGARLITTLGPITGVTQPSPLTNAATGLVDCGNWSVSASWAVPTSTVSGLYIARLIRADNNGASHIAFVVRDDASQSDLLFKTSDATWQAYNVYGGNSLYVGSTSFANGHAAKVSYNRPFITRAGGGGGGVAEDWLFNAEYPMIRFLERNGYYLSYTTDLDMERDPAPILPASHKVFLSVGHDEYWSLAERNKVEAARNAGVHLAFFSANEVYWKTRWENSIDASNTPYRTLICYKEGTLGENVCNGECDPSTQWTGLWRDGCGASATDGCKPENALSGQISWVDITSAIEVPAAYKNHRFWRNTAVANLGNGQSLTLPYGTLGYEWDWENPTYVNNYPSGRITLSSTTINNKTHKLSLYRHSSGSLVFGAGTVQWAWGLDNVHDRGNAPVSVAMQQATVNLFADMGVQPATLQATLVAATASTDFAPPTVVINAPAHGAALTPGSPTVISGTAAEANVLVGIEVSIDGGTTWKPATGTNNWTFSWTPPSTGTVTIKVRGFDDSGNMGVPGVAPAADAITVNVGGEQTCPCTIWNPLTIPGTQDAQDGAAVELGMKFRSYANGYITGIRFYKSSANAGVHIGNLWTEAGVNLGTKSFSNESSSGWQEVSFTSPVAIIAGTTYVASYHTNAGHYAQDENYFLSSGIRNGNLEALQNGTDGPNGLYKYSATSAFPASSFEASNYYVDVVFVPSPAISITKQPLNQSACKNAEVKFISKANSPAALNVQWQHSSNGTNWADILGGTQDTLVLIATEFYAEHHFRAIWTNEAGSVNSAEAILTIAQVKGIINAQTDNACFGGNDGNIAIAGSGGTSPYTFSMDGISYQGSGVFTNLAANDYLIRIKDSNGCIGDTSVLIKQPPIITPAIVNPALACQEDQNGTITIAGSGGTSPFTYSKDGINYFASGIFTGLGAGNYLVHIKDANNCVRDTLVIVGVEKSVWTGAVNSDWHNMNNWNTLKVPGAFTHVIIPSGTPHSCIISTANAMAASIQLKPGVTINVINNFRIQLQGTCTTLPPD